MVGDDDVLDILGQLPGLKIYTQMCLCYNLPDNKGQSEIIEKIKTGLAQLAESIPWVAARVQNESSSKGNTGIWSFKPLESSPRLVVKDLRDDPKKPTMQQLIKSNFPIALLDEADIAPIVTLPTLVPATEISKDSPVFVLQATFITGGLILTCVAEHTTMDGTGQGQILYLLSKACRGEAFTSCELSSGNLARKNLIPLFDSSYKLGPELDDQIFRPKESQIPSGDGESPSPPTCSWANFGFSSHAQKKLKDLASKSLTLGVDFVSTDDAVTAFIWQSVTRVRQTKLASNAEVRLARAVDVRSFFQVPTTYPGMIQSMTYENWPLEVLLKSELGSIASNLRREVQPSTSKLVYNTRALATQIDRTPDKSIFSLTASLKPSKDLMISSWSKLNSYDLDFGLGLGKPLAVRRPQFTPVEGLAYLLPRSPSGEVVLALCLSTEDIEQLKMDASWNEYATYIG